MRRIPLACALALLAAACAVTPPTPPSFYVEPLPPGLTGDMTLEQRIAAEDGWKALREGRGDKAEADFLRLGPDHPVGRAGLGYVAWLRGDLETARESFEAALRLREDLLPARIALAQIYETTGPDDRLFTEYREILKIDPEHAWARPRFEALRDRKTKELRDAAAAALQGGDRDAARTGLLSVLFYDPESVDAHLELARLYAEDKMPDEAAVHLKAAADLRPDDPRVWRLYAQTLSGSEQYGRSLEAYEKAARLDPADKETAARIGQLKEKLGVFDLPSRYAEIPAEAAVTREDVAALIAVKFQQDFGAETPKPPVLVDIGTAWAQKMIIRVAALDLMEVYDNHTFQPGRTVTRAELAETLRRLAERFRERGLRLVDQIPADRIRIADVPPDHVDFPAIVQAVALQLMELSAGAFRPEAPATGDEAVRAFDALAALVR